jgi:hypothetical protein
MKTFRTREASVKSAWSTTRTMGICEEADAVGNCAQSEMQYTRHTTNAGAPTSAAHKRARAHMRAHPPVRHPHLNVVCENALVAAMLFKLDFKLGAVEVVLIHRDSQGRDPLAPLL